MKYSCQAIDESEKKNVISLLFLCLYLRSVCGKERNSKKACLRWPLPPSKYPIGDVNNLYAYCQVIIGAPPPKDFLKWENVWLDTREMFLLIYFLFSCRGSSQSVHCRCAWLQPSCVLRSSIIVFVYKALARLACHGDRRGVSQVSEVKLTPWGKNKNKTWTCYSSSCVE